MEEVAYRVSCTGHRKFLRKEAVILEYTKTRLQELTAGKTNVEVNTGMALGFDQLVCEACLSLGIPYVAVVPCDEQDALWTPSQRERYKDLLAGAARVVEVNPGPYEAWKMHARNKWLVDHADVMMVHWDGLFQGGTGACMKLVVAKKLQWHNTIPPITRT